MECCCRIELETKSRERKTLSAIIAGAGNTAFAVVASAVLANLPNPNQF